MTPPVLVISHCAAALAGVAAALLTLGVLLRRQHEREARRLGTIPLGARQGGAR
ncbi:hypothetical protein [Geminisphaera colitermitum]|uniref:hypothetical protein n=1 Tax=Geminisphaera colitermitum TaxID=1148786 RepID=UPI0001965553|nr:hypothetical protein [Geminisphaera colitermitum]